MKKRIHSTARWLTAIPSEFFFHITSLSATGWVIFLRVSSPDQTPHLAAMEKQLRAASPHSLPKITPTTLLSSNLASRLVGRSWLNTCGQSLKVVPYEISYQASLV